MLFPQNPNDLNNFAWNCQKGIVRDPELGPTGYEENDFMQVHSLYSCNDNRLKYDKFYPVVKPN